VVSHSIYKQPLAIYVEQVRAPCLGLHVVEKLQLSIMNVDGRKGLWISTEPDKVYGDNSGLPSSNITIFDTDSEAY
jgi:hypothetical protein